MICYLQMIETPEDQTKFEVLYSEYRGLMYHVAFSILNHEQDAEDAVHQVFVKVAENMQFIKEPISVKTKSFLVTLVENRAIDICRAKARHKEVPFDDNTVGLVVEYRGPDEVSLCLSKLPARYREALTLKYNHGLTNKELAKVLCLSYENTKKLVQRARAALQSLCEKEGVL